MPSADGQRGNALRRHADGPGRGCAPTDRQYAAQFDGRSAGCARLAPAVNFAETAAISAASSSSVGSPRSTRSTGSGGSCSDTPSTLGRIG
jgi:hypothetical protein